MTESTQLGPMPPHLTKACPVGCLETNPAYADWWQQAARMALEYATHRFGCGYSHPWVNVDGETVGEHRPCDCGLDDLRKAIGEAK